MADLDHTVLPELAHLIQLQLETIPQLGRLMLKGRPLHVGDRFSQADINEGHIRYEQTENLPEGAVSANDGFRFILVDNNTEIRDPALYDRACLPVPEIPVAEDCVYEFKIKITGAPSPTGSSLDIQLAHRATKIITDYNINVASEGSDKGQIVHQIIQKPTAGRLLIKGGLATMFTQQDVYDGKLSYQHTGPAMDDVFVVESCTQFSKCRRQTVHVRATDGLAFTGDNVFYARVSSKWRMPLTANRTPLLWELVGGDDRAPYLSTPASGVISWSYFDTQYDSAPDASPLRGLGYDKLPEFRNLPFRFQWNAGLPFGVYVDNADGVVWTANRMPYNPEEDSTWKLPQDPATFTWTMRITDPHTGETATRQFTLHVTTSGQGPNGQVSESN